MDGENKNTHNRAKNPFALSNSRLSTSKKQSSIKRANLKPPQNERMKRQCVSEQRPKPVQKTLFNFGSTAKTNSASQQCSSKHRIAPTNHQSGPTQTKSSSIISSAESSSSSGTQKHPFKPMTSKFNFRSKFKKSSLSKSTIQSNSGVTTKTTSSCKPKHTFGQSPGIAHTKSTTPPSTGHNFKSPSGVLGQIACSNSGFAKSRSHQMVSSNQSSNKFAVRNDEMSRNSADCTNYTKSNNSKISENTQHKPTIASTNQAAKFAFNNSARSVNATNNSSSNQMSSQTNRGSTLSSNRVLNSNSSHKLFSPIYQKPTAPPKYQTNLSTGSTAPPKYPTNRSSTGSQNQSVNPAANRSQFDSTLPNKTANTRPSGQKNCYRSNQIHPISNVNMTHQKPRGLTQQHPRTAHLTRHTHRLQAIFHTLNPIQSQALRNR
eukprot:1269_1